MNYQKFFSRFYSSSDQPNGELLPKYVVFSGNNDPSSSNAGNANENNEFIEFQQQFVDQVNEEFIDPTVNNDVPQVWNVPSPEETNIVVEPLAPEEVRWFYKCKDEKIWTEFNGYDSILIEEKYRLLPPSPQGEENAQLPGLVAPEEFVNDLKGSQTEDVKNEGLHSKYKDEFGDFSPKRFLRFNQKSDGGSSTAQGKFSVKSDSESSEDSWDENITVDVDRDRIVVRGGLYEVDLAKMTCESIYWPGEKYAITRGLYFYDGSWQPLERCHGEVVETEHLRLFGNNLENIKHTTTTTGIAVHRQNFPEFHIEWMSCNEIYLYWGGAPRQLVRSVTQKLGFYQSTGYRLRRGYRTRASMTEKPSDITHVVFVIHGIGQKMDEGRIIRNTNTLRSICEWLRIHYPGCGEGRAELFPARWRAGARGRASGLLAAAAPPGAPALRRAINEAAMDVMYYTSPLYGKQVQDDLRRELNRLYTMFMARNPQFNGRFSAVAHSLGSVILYDLIIDYQIGCEHCAGMGNPVKQKLLFPLQHLFCIGSPLSVFLAMRHPNPSLSAVLPKEFTPRLYNIFHSSDPVAYRLEPLISPCQANLPPVVIQSYDTSPNNHVSSPARSSWKIWSYVKHPWQKPSDENMQRHSENDVPSQSQYNKVEENILLDEDEVEIIQSDVTECCSHRVMTTIIRKDKNIPISKNATYTRDNNDKTAGNKPINTSDFKTLEENIIVKVEDTIETKISVIDDNTSLTPDIKILDDKSPRKKSADLKDYKKFDEMLPYRLDYTLRDTGMANNYLSAMTSHTGYWSNYDVAQFILSNLTLETKDNIET